MSETVLVAVASGVVGASGATVVWGALWLHRIEEVTREAEQRVFDAAGQQLTKVIGRSAVPVYDVWERDVLAGPTMELPMIVGRPVAVVPTEVVARPAPSLLDTLLILAQCACEQGLRWVRARVVALALPVRRASEHQGWDTPEGLAELQQAVGRPAGRHRADRRAAAGATR